MQLESLVDDAAVFPPGNASMSSAVDAHLRYAGSDHAHVVGRFLCPVSRLPECASRLRDDLRLSVGLIADTGVDGVADALDFAAIDRRVVPEAVEVPIPVSSSPRHPSLTSAMLADDARAVVALLPELTSYVEVPREEGWREVLDVLTDHGAYAKLRTGGVTPAAFPPAAGVAAFIAGCVERSLPFKCTAGLHHAVRWRDPALGWHHGFVNVLAAVHAALGGVSSADLVDVLELTRGDLLLAALPESDDEWTAVREAFHGFGSCSVREPVEDLQRLGLL